MTKHILLERKLSSEFTMGFELEGFWKVDEFNTQSDESILDDIEDCFKTVFTDKSVLMNNSTVDIYNTGNLHTDGSLEPDGDDDEPFEWSSPIVKVNINTFNQIIRFLEKNLNNKFYTNETCGFHHHISFPDISAEDVIWILSKLSLDNNMLADLSYFNDHNFVSRFSNITYLKEHLRKAVEDFNYGSIVNICNTDKFSLINVHSAGKTLEWRGPRGFLDDGNLQEIKDFYKVVWKFIQWIIDTLDETEINGMSKENFIKGIQSTGITLKSFPWNTPHEDKVMSADKVESFVNEIISEPKKLFKFSTSPVPFEQLIQRLFNRRRLVSLTNKLNNEFDTTYPPLKRLDSLAYKYIPYYIIANHRDMVDEDILYRTSQKTLQRYTLTSQCVGLTVKPTHKGAVIVNNKLYKSINKQSLLGYEKDIVTDFIHYAMVYFYNFPETKTINAFKEFIEYMGPEFASYYTLEDTQRVCEALSSVDDTFLTYALQSPLKDNQDIANMIKEKLYLQIYDNPKNILPLVTLTRNGLYALMIHWKKEDISQYYDMLKPLILSTQHISEEEFDTIDRDITIPKSNRISMDVPTDEGDIQYK